MRRETSLFCCVLLVTLTACGTVPVARRPLVAGQSRAVAVESRRAERVARRVKAYVQRTPIVRGRALVTWVGNDGERETELVLVVARPDRLRVDAVDQLADAWAMVGSDGASGWLLLPGSGRLYRGLPTQKNMRRLADFHWELTELTSWLAGGVPFVTGSHVLEVQSEGGRHFRLADHQVHLWCDAEGRVIRAVRYADDEERSIDYELTFADYRLVAGLAFPFELSATFPGRHGRLHLRYREVMVGGEIDPAVFTAPRLAGVKTIDLD